MGIPFFDIAALPIFFLIFWTVVLRKMTRGRCNVLYLAVIIMSIIADSSEIIEKTLTYNYAPLTHDQMNIVRFFNYTYYVTRNAVNLSYVFFIIAITRTWYKIAPFWKKFLICLPYLGILGFLIYNIPTSFVFSVTPEFGYQRGVGVIFTYSFAFIYLMYGVVYLLRYRRTIDWATWVALMSMYFFNFIAVIIQLIFSGIQIESFATSLTLFFVIVFVQRPEKKVDLSTGLPGYPSFREEIGKIKATGHDVKIMIITMKNAVDMNRYLGEKAYYEYVYSIEELIRKGATPDLSVVTVVFPEEIPTPEELFDFGHNYIRFSNLDKKFTRASAIITQKTYQIESHIVDILQKS